MAESLLDKVHVGVEFTMYSLIGGRLQHVSTNCVHIMAHLQNLTPSLYVIYSTNKSPRLATAQYVQAKFSRCNEHKQQMNKGNMTISIRDIDCIVFARPRIYPIHDKINTRHSLELKSPHCILQLNLHQQSVFAVDDVLDNWIFVPFVTAREKMTGKMKMKIKKITC